MATLLDSLARCALVDAGCLVELVLAAEFLLELVLPSLQLQLLRLLLGQLLLLSDLSLLESVDDFLLLVDECLLSSEYAGVQLVALELFDLLLVHFGLFYQLVLLL